MAIWVLFSLDFLACRDTLPKEGMILFTQIPAKEVSAGQLEQIDYRYLPDMQIVMADIQHPENNPEIISRNFYSARAAELSYDGKRLIFSGQKAKDDIWQIWTLDLNKNKLSQVTQAQENATDPAWLPDGRIVYSQIVHHEKGINYHALYTIGLDGCCAQRITFHPHEDLNASVLNDGRVLFSSQQIFPDTGVIKFLAMRPDGTKAELFYLPENATYTSKAWDDFNSNVGFVESGVPVYLNFNRPLHSKDTLIQTLSSKTHSLYALDPGYVVVADKKSELDPYYLSIWDEDQDYPNQTMGNPAYHYIEPIVIQTREVPKNLPSRLDVQEQTGYFVCMNVNYPNQENLSSAGSASKVQVWGMDDAVGEAPILEDGSFYLEVTADSPLRFQTLDVNGTVNEGPSAWIWVRPGERRGCVGCHANKEMAPPNVIPKAIEKGAVALEY